MQTCKEVIQLLRRCRARASRASSLGPVYHPDRASPFPCLRGEACGLAGAAQPGPRLCPRSQLPTLESQAEQSGGPLETQERVTVRGRGIHGQEPTYCVHSLTHYFTHPSPILTHLFIFYTQTHRLSSSHFFFFFSMLLSSDTLLCYQHNSCLTAPLNTHPMLSSTRSTI